MINKMVQKVIKLMYQQITLNIQIVKKNQHKLNKKKILMKNMENKQTLQMIFQINDRYNKTIDGMVINSTRWNV